MEEEIKRHIIKWYGENVDNTLSMEFLNHMMVLGVFKMSGNEKDDLEKINKLLLIVKNGVYVKNENNQYMMKPQRKKAMESLQEKPIIKTPNRFKLTTLKGNKLKLIRLD